jgi:hypothetical protein
MDGATTLAQTTSDRTKKVKENKEGVAGGTRSHPSTSLEWGDEN